MSTTHATHSVVRTARSLIKAAYATLGILVVLFVGMHIVNAFYISHETTVSDNAFTRGLDAEMQRLKEQGDAVAQSSDLLESVLLKDRERLLDVISRERASRDIGLMGVADAAGVMLGRTFSRGTYGDTVFLTAPAGRAVSDGRSVESVEMTGFGDQMFITTARPLLQEGQMIGALFANALLDDAYGVRFRDTYLPQGTQVAFYSKAYGIYGASFADIETKTVIKSYFNPGSDWVENGLSDKTIVFEDGTTYVVKNVIFPGLEQSPGGALLFIPLQDRTTLSNLIISVLALGAFVFFALRNHRRMHDSAKGAHYWILLVLTALGVFGMSFFVFYANGIGRLRLKHIPYPLYNSNLRFQPASGLYAVGYEQRITVYVDTGDEPINVVDVSVQFDPSLVDVVELDDSHSPCSHVVEKSIDPVVGIAVFTCGTVDTLVKDRALPIVDIVVVPRKSGAFTLSFDKRTTRVLAGDGLGTDVLRSIQDSTYRVDDFSTDGAHATIPNTAIVLFSPTHSNESRWYNTPQARFVWSGLAGESYRYVFDASPLTVPTNHTTTIARAVTVDIPGDGLYYFHIQRKSGGPISHYLIRSDRTPPIITSMDLSSSSVAVGDVVRFDFDATDNVSGIQRNYYIDLGNDLLLPIGRQLFVPLLSKGSQTIRLRVYDNAGNYAEEMKTIHVTASDR